MKSCPFCYSASYTNWFTVWFTVVADIDLIFVLHLSAGIQGLNIVIESEVVFFFKYLGSPNRRSCSRFSFPAYVRSANMSVSACPSLPQTHGGRHQGALLPSIVCQAAQVCCGRARPWHRVCAPLHRQGAQRPAFQQALPQ